MTEEQEYEQYLIETGQKPAPAANSRIDTPSWVPDWVKSAASSVAAKQAGLANAATLGYGNLEDLPVVGDSFKQASEESPVARSYGTATGMVGPGAAMGAGAARVGGKLLNSAPGRVGLNAAQGGIEGLIRKPVNDETRLGNAYEGARNAALVGGAMEGGMKALQGGGKLAQWLGGKLGGLDKAQTEAFKRSPQEADRLAFSMENDPKGISDEVRAKIGGGLEETFDNISEPALNRVGKAVMHKSVNVRPDQFRGTAAEPEITRAWNLRNPQRHAPYTEVTPYEVRSTPVEPRMNFGAIDEQTAFLPNRPYDSPEVPVQSVSRSISKAGPEQVVSRGFTPGEIVHATTAPIPTPEVMALRGPQALRSKRAAQKAASYKKAVDGPAYREADDADALAATRLKLGLEGAAPDVTEANQVLSEAAEYSGAARAKFANNPAAILVDSDSAGSVPTRAMRQFIDKHGNAGLQNMSDSLGAGRKLAPPSSPEGMYAGAKRIGARGAIQASGKADAAASTLKDQKLRAFLGQATSRPEKDNSPSAEELAEYEQYLRETGQK